MYYFARCILVQDDFILKIFQTESPLSLLILV